VLGSAACLAAAPSGLPVWAAGAGAQSWTLAGGVAMPLLALNTAGMSADASERSVKEAYAAGIKHVDFHPGIERDGVARALGSVPRDAMFLTTKISKPAVGTAPSAAGELVTKQIDEDLRVLGLDSVDMLMLRDSPDPVVMQAQWAAMEDALASKRTRAISTINYCEGSLSAILATAKTPPALNYIMQHVGMGHDDSGLRAFGEKRGIRTFAYGAVGEPGPSDELLTSEVLRQIGAAHGGRSVEEVALRWVVQGGCAVSVRPTTDFKAGASACAAGTEACSAGLRTRAKVFDWALTPAEMRTLDAMKSPTGNPTLFSSTGCPGSFFAAK
tara:strand:- start:577 stop:1563 length:987 start_codon:yes stop_codon:yes gene_type:complete